APKGGEGLRFPALAFLGFGVRVGGVDEGLPASVAVSPVIAAVAVARAAAIPANPTLGMFVGCASSGGSLSRPSAAVLLQFFLVLLLFTRLAEGKFGLKLRVGGGVFGINDGLLEGHEGLH